MALSVNSNFSVNCALPIEERFVLSKEQMLNANPNIIPDVYFCVCSDDGQFYLYNKDNVGNAETGKYEKLASSGVDDTDIWKESTEYVVGKIVKYNGKKYQCITLHTSSTVFEDDSVNWIELVETYALLTKAQHDYLIDNGLLEDKIYVKVDDVSEGDLVDFDGITIKEFDVNVEYQAGEYVIYDNAIYRANVITTNIDVGTFIDTEWDLISGSKTVVVDELIDGDIESAVSTNQVYQLSQKFVDNVKLDYTTNEIVMVSVNGEEKRFDISSFIKYVLSSVNTCKSIYCDAKPTLTTTTDSTTGENLYMATYTKEGVETTVNATNVWFYYSVNNGSTSTIFQTIFVDGVELTLTAGTINDVLAIDETTKNWLINGIDTGVCSEGKSPTITENSNNSELNYQLDITDAEGNVTTTPNLKGNDGVAVPLNGFCYIHIVDGNLVLDCEAGATPLPLSLEGDKLYYTLGGEIQYVSKETITTD